MGPANCAVLGCLNNSKKLIKFQDEHCLVHVGMLHKDCVCPPPYCLWMFPSVKLNNERRQVWIKLMRRVTPDNRVWKPCSSDRVCSDQFVDGIPTVENPYPSLKLGYEVKETKPRRQIIRKIAAVDYTDLGHPSSFTDADMSSSSIDTEHDYYKTVHIPCSSCDYKDALIASLHQKIAQLSSENQRLNNMNINLTRKSKKFKPFSSNSIKSDKEMNFYTGLSSIKLFDRLFDLLAPYASNLNYWRGTKRIISTKVRSRKFVPSEKRKLSRKNEFLLTLMRLRLGILNEDIAKRFDISPTTCSNTFKTWIRFLAMTVGKLVAWLPKENIVENMPVAYRKAGHSKLRVVIDCSEIFIERPKSLDAQAATWSDYKSHNTVKFLIGISPAGFVTFLSDCYGGRASDRFITSDSGFYDCLDPYDEVMADRGFQIKEELMLKFCSLSVSPGARVKAQMTSSECKRTKDVANLRIHVERAINRIKTYRILKTVLPISMLHNVDDIVKTCAGLYNLKPLLFKDSIKT